MQYKILATQLRKIIEDARLLANDGGKEICGLLIDNGYFIEMIKLKNRKKRGGGFSFYLKEADFIEKACQIMNHEIIGTFHSHPCSIAKPSESDKIGAFENELMLLIDVMENEVKLWQISNQNEKELGFDLIE